MDYEAVLFGAVMLVALAEGVMSWRWVAPYFRSGIPVFGSRIPYEPLVLPDRLEVSLTDKLRSNATSSIVVHRLSDVAFAFREPMYEKGMRLRYTPLMHGTIEFKPYDRAIEVYGRLNWTPIVLMIAFVIEANALPVGSRPLVIGVVGIIMGICYLVQALRYRSVVRELRRDANDSA